MIGARKQFPRELIVVASEFSWAGVGWVGLGGIISPY